VNIEQSFHIRWNSRRSFMRILRPPTHELMYVGVVVRLASRQFADHMLGYHACDEGTRDEKVGPDFGPGSVPAFHRAARSGNVREGACHGGQEVGARDGVASAESLGVEAFEQGLK